ncbi:MAG: DUF1697 domain-containing protein [Gemmatimonadaceae bacterium]
MQSGYVIFESQLSEKSVRKKLEAALTRILGKRADVIVRTASEMKAALKANPSPNVEPARIGVYFHSHPVSKSQIAHVQGPAGEEVRLGKREFYIHFPIGMGQSKLKLPAGVGTMRNMNTVAKLVDLTGR